MNSDDEVAPHSNADDTREESLSLAHVKSFQGDVNVDAPKEGREQLSMQCSHCGSSGNTKPELAMSSQVPLQGMPNETSAAVVPVAATAPNSPPLYQPHAQPAYQPLPYYHHATSYPYQGQPPPPSPQYTYNRIAHSAEMRTDGSQGVYSSRDGTVIPHSAATSNIGPILLSAVALGSVLGLTAAAAVRWLNGGDFIVFPPAFMGDSSATASDGAALADENTTDDPKDSLDTVSPEVEEVHNWTGAQNDEISPQENGHGRPDRHAGLLQRLEELVAKQREMEEYIEVTNQSIDALREQQQVASLQSSLEGSAHREIATWLGDIKSELTSIREHLATTDSNSQNRRDETVVNGVADPSELHSRLSTVLAKLDATLHTDGDEGDEKKFDEGPNSGPGIDDTMIPSAESNANSKPDSNNPAQGRTNPLLKAFSEAIQLNPSMINDAGRTISSTTSLASLGCSSALRDAITELVTANSKEKLVSGAQLLYLYVVNVASHPRVPRYRKIHCSNESYQSNVAALQGASELLVAVGFVERQPNANVAHGSSKASYWEWLPSPKTAPSDDEMGSHVASTTTDPISPSNAPQKPWFDDTEATYVVRLKEATAALSVLKVASALDKADLIKAALTSAGLLVEDRQPVRNKQAGPVVSFASRINAAEGSCENHAGCSTSNADGAMTPQRKNVTATFSPDTNLTTPANNAVALSLVEDSDAATPDRAMDIATAPIEVTPNSGGLLSTAHVDPALLETPPVSGSILSPPVTKSLMTLNKDFSLLENPLPQSASPEELESSTIPSQVLQFTTNELLEEMEHIESEAASLADEAEAAMWK